MSAKSSATQISCDTRHILTYVGFERFENTFEFFILSGLRDGPRSLTEIRQRLQWAERLLYLAARRNGIQDHGSLLRVLAKLQKEGCLRVEQKYAPQARETVYFLTDSGALRLEQERARQNLIVRQFLEEGDLDRSFRRFLDGNLFGAV